jgi:hypothetical protein
MSLVKLAAMPLLVINNSDPNAGSSKTFNAKNVAAAAVGGTTGFALSDAIEQHPKFDKKIMSHRYGRRMGSVMGGFVGAATTYALLHKKKQEQKPNFYML